MGALFHGLDHNLLLDRNLWNQNGLMVTEFTNECATLVPLGGRFIPSGRPQGVLELVEIKSTVPVTLNGTPSLTGDKWLLEASGISFAMAGAYCPYGADWSAVEDDATSAGGCPTLNVSRITR